MKKVIVISTSLRDIYLLTTAAEAEEETPQRAEMGLTGWVKEFEDARYFKGNSYLAKISDKHKRI